MSRPNTPDVKTDTGTRITMKRCCNGCGRQVGDVTDAEIEASLSGAGLPDVRTECGCAALTDDEVAAVRRLRWEAANDPAESADLTRVLDALTRTTATVTRTRTLVEPTTTKEQG